MKSKIYLVLGFFLLSISIQSQDFDNYTPLKSKGKIPRDITKRVMDEVIEQSLEIDTENDRRRLKKKKQSFILSSNFFMDELLASGYILYGDEITEYINQIADKVLAERPALRKELRFYCLKSNMTNAFSTHQGMIFINLGLISQLENEAQLAFIIGHEVTHYLNKHSINEIEKQDEIISVRRGGIDENILSMSSYSKDLEFQADSLGYQILKNTGYDINAAMTVFDVLQFAHLPYDEIALDYSIYENELYTIPSSLRLKNIEEIDLTIDDDDSRSTHPNLDKRRKRIQQFQDQDKITGDKFIVKTKAEFEAIRKISRYEGIRYRLQSRDFVHALYDSQYLMQEDPDSYYLQNATFKALYGIAHYKIANIYNDTFDSYNTKEGRLGEFHYFFSNMPTDVAAKQAMRLGWKLNKAHPNEKTEERLYSLVNNYTRLNSVDVDEFCEKVLAEPQPIIAKDTTTVVDSLEIDKYDKLRKLKKDSEEEVTNLFYDIEDKEGFVNMVKEWYHIEPFRLPLREQKKLDKLEEKEKNYINAEKLVLINPKFYTLDGYNRLNRQKSEDGKYHYLDQIKKVSTAAGLDIKILSPKLFKEEETEAYNDMALANEWHYESNLHYKKLDEYFIPSEADYIQELKEKYGTNKIMFSTIVEGKEYRKHNNTVLAICLYSIVGIPYYVYHSQSRVPHSKHYTFAYDIETGEQLVYNVTEINSRASKSNINSLMYDLFIQMKSSKSTKQ